MTNFITLNLGPKTESKKTKFETLVVASGEQCEASQSPIYYDNVLWLYYDISYGDVFIAWMDGLENNREIYFGTKGDEF